MVAAGIWAMVREWFDEDVMGGERTVCVSGGCCLS